MTGFLAIALAIATGVYYVLLTGLLRLCGHPADWWPPWHSIGAPPGTEQNSDRARSDGH